MTENTNFDVAIVGASIAGCTAATFLGRQGARVALVESHSDPHAYKRMCTHVFQASSSPTIRRLGILERARRGGGTRERVNIWSRYGWISPSRAYMDRIDEDGVGLNIRRQMLDPMLRRTAADTDGVELMMGHTATSLLREGERVTGVVVRPREGAERELSARLVVGADGRSSGIGKLAGQKTKTRANNRFVYMAYYRDTPLISGDLPQMWFLDPDMAYAFPTDDELTMLACVAHKDRMPEFKADPEAAMARMYERVPDGPRLDPAKRVSDVLGKLDAPNERRRPTGRGSPWSATPPSPPTRSGGLDADGRFRPASGLRKRRARRSATRRSSTAPCAATPVGTAGRWRNTTASARPTRAGTSSTRPKSSSSAAPRGTMSLPAASRSSASAGSSRGSSLTPSMLKLMLRANLGRGRQVPGPQRASSRSA